MVDAAKALVDDDGGGNKQRMATSLRMSLYSNA